MKYNKWMQLVLAASVVLATPVGVVGAATSFPDVSESYWAKDAIIALKDRGVINGIQGRDGALYFQPNGNVTRAEFAKMLTDGFGLSVSDTAAGQFRDVGGHWGAKYIGAAVAAGIIKGYEDRTYRPQNNISREEMAAILQRLIRGANLADQQTSYTFADDSKISTWARTDVYQAQARGLVNVSGNNFEPKRLATRAEAAYMIFNTIHVITSAKQPVFEANNVKMVAATKNGDLTVYDGKTWQPKFWRGVNLGATTPGHYPGELSPTKADYLRWFAQMKEMNTDVVRVYTILPPHFYEALDQFNRGRTEPLYLMQGIWSPEEELIGEDGKGNDAYDMAITNKFVNEIKDIVRVVHGDAVLPAKRGHASGTYRTDVSKYMVGWLVGTEWYQYAVDKTNKAHPNQPRYDGTYVEAKAGASAFESWVAKMLDTVAVEEMRYGWQHPLSFTNWVTTDPLTHPNEPFVEEDMVSVDPMKVGVKANFTAGYFSTYHVYPYYPDFLRFEEKYQTYRDSTGKINPYAGYLKDMREYHKDIPLLVSEFGMPSSRGMAHRGPLDRNQGMHTEQEQGKMLNELLASVYNEGYDGGIVFSWQDEWFKRTWNTMDLTTPDRRPMWFNRLTNEANFGLLAVEPGKSADELIYLDGKTDDWTKRPKKGTYSYPNFDLSVAHDEAYFYLLAKKKTGTWDFAKETLDIGFDTITGGSTKADLVPNATFATPIEFLLQLKGAEKSKLYVNSGYDQHTWQYGSKLKSIPFEERYKDDKAGTFLEWKLALSKELYLPATKRTIPFEELHIGDMKPGKTVPSDPQFNSLADWYASGSVLEARIPWTLLGFWDPSQLQVWDYPYKAGGIKPVSTTGVRVQPVLSANGTVTGGTAQPLSYTWEKWDLPTYHERKKASYFMVRDAFKTYSTPKK